MARPVIAYLALGMLVLFGAGALWVQRESGALLRNERDGLREQLRDAAQARAENVRLLASQLAPAQMDALRADRAAVARMQDEVANLKKELAQPIPPPEKPRMVPAAEWKNAGRATAAAAVETVFWAAAGGDVDALAATVSFVPQDRSTIDAFFAALPENLQKQYQTPERLVAFFTAKDIPLSAMRVVGQKEQGPDDMSVAVLVDVPDGKPRATILAVHREADGWRLRVPVAAVQGYANTIGLAVADGAKP